MCVLCGCHGYACMGPKSVLMVFVMLSDASCTKPGVLAEESMIVIFTRAL
jgi:hypothetical protein